jgi:peptidoglycan hydrolase-like protein with peptidoglycan-binding domain
MLRAPAYPDTLESDARLGEMDRRSPAYVRWVQQSLNRLGGAGLAVDGALGPRTRDAVRAFQGRRGLAADGVVGPRTEAALIAAGASSPPGAPAPGPPNVPRPPGTLADAVRQNEALARSLGWDVLRTPIAGWILNLPEATPSAEAFARAVATWQGRRGLPANGVLDYATWRQMLRDAKDGIPRPYRSPEGVDRPHGRAAVVTTFGDPTQRGWEGRSIVRVSAPAGRQFQRGVTTLPVHRLVARHFERLFAAINDRGLWAELVPTAGTYVCRTKYQPDGSGKKKCGTPGINPMQLSTHSWGITIDIRPNDYRFITLIGQRLGYPPPILARIFQAHGFHWGLWFMSGTLDSRGRIDLRGADPMHFQFATRY